MAKKVERDVEKEIIEVIDRIKPYIEGDGGGLQYVKFEDGIVYVRLLGACVNCGLIDFTLKDGIESMLMDEIPEVMGVQQI